MTDTQMISAAFPYESKYVDVNGASMHYVEQGEGDPIIFVHGIPTSNYLWRNIIPHVSQHGRCIALDLIGFGKSDKPDIEYSVFDHIAYLTDFIEALDLKNVTLVLHAWGSVIGFDYAMRHQDNIKAVAFLEAHVRLSSIENELSLPLQEFLMGLNYLDKGFDSILEDNLFIERVLNAGVLRRLSEEEIAAYKAPFPDAKSRKPILRFLQDLPSADGDPRVAELINNYSKKLQASTLPKLMFYAIPGFNTTIDTVTWAKESLPNLALADVGDALHFAPESNPHTFGEQLAEWYQGLG